MKQTGSGEEHYFQVHIRVLQPDPHILGQPRRAFADCVPRMGEGKRADGRLNCYTISSVNPGGLSLVAYREWARANALAVA